MLGFGCAWSRRLAYGRIVYAEASSGTLCCSPIHPERNEGAHSMTFCAKLDRDVLVGHVVSVPMLSCLGSRYPHLVISLRAG